MRVFIPAALLLMLITAAACAQELMISDTIGRVWVREPVAWTLPGVKTGGVLLLRDGQPIASQVVANGDGSQVLFMIDDLPPYVDPPVSSEGSSLRMLA